MSTNNETWNELLAEIEKLAVSVGRKHPLSTGLGFNWDQTEIINNIIRLGVKTGDFGDEAER